MKSDKDAAINFLGVNIMDTTKALQKLLDGTASEEEVALLKQGLVSGEISIGGNVNHSVIIIGNGNTVELPSAALDRLNARPLLGNLDRDLTGDEIASGLKRLESELPLRAPVLMMQFQEQSRRLRPSLKTSSTSLSEHVRKERVEALAVINSLCMEALDISFNALCLGEEPPEYDPRSPFRGLESFRPEDSEFFFGREALTKILIGKIRSHPFLAVLGSSGSGKSSLVMAGVIPALDLDYVVFRPGTDSLAALESALSSATEKALIMVDQFEELFTLTRDETTRKEFVTKLLGATKRRRHCVVLTLRSDFLGEVASYRALSEEVQNHLEIVRPMDTDELRSAMEGQARAVGLHFEADLSQQILDDVEGEPGAMPLLQHALWELWNRRHGHWLRASEYRAFGRVKEAITSTAEKVYGEYAESEQEKIRGIFLRLTRVDENNEGRDTRRRVALNDLVPSGRESASTMLLINKLADARLIVKTVIENKAEVEVAHEALILYWKRLRTWLDEDRDNLRLRQSVSEDARKWENASRDESLLNHRGTRLNDALFLSKDPHYGLNDMEQAYLKECMEYQKREEKQRERFITGLVVSVVLLLIAAIFAFTQWNTARQQTEVAVARTDELNDLAIVAQANKSLTDHNPDLAIALAWHANQGEKPLEKAYAALLDASYITLARSVYTVCQQNENGPDWATTVDISTDSKTIAIGCSNNNASKIYILNPSSGKTQAEWTYPSWLHDLAFNPDGKSILAGYANNTAILWSYDGTLISSLEEHDDAVSAVAFSSDGTLALTGSYDKSIILWDIAGGTFSHIISSTQADFTGKFTSVEFSPKGGQVVLGDDAGNVFVWNYEENFLDYPLEKHSNFVLDVGFSPDGSKIISSSADSTIAIWDFTDYITQESVLDISKTYPGVWVKSVKYFRDDTKILTALSNGLILLWDVRSMQVIQTMEGHLSEIEHLSISSDGMFAISASRDGIVRLWDLQTFTDGIDISDNEFETDSILISSDNSRLFAATANGHVNVWDTESKTLMNDWAAYPETVSVPEIALSPDQNSLLTAGSNGTAILWDIASHGSIWQYSKNSDNVRSVDINPDGSLAILGYVSGEIVVVDLKTGQLTCSLTGHTNAVNSVRFSPDGKSAVSGSNDYNVALWDISTCQNQKTPFKVLFQHDGWVMAVKISPNGNLIASASADNTIIIWNLDTQQQMYRLQLPDMGINSGLDAFVLSLDFNADGRLLSSGSANGNVALWSVTNGILLRKYISFPAETCQYGIRCFWVLSTKFSPNGDILWASTSDGRILGWQLIPDSSSQELQDWLAKNRYIRGLTEQEKAAYEIGE